MQEELADFQKFARTELILFRCLEKALFFKKEVNFVANLFLEFMFFLLRKTLGDIA